MKRISHWLPVLIWMLVIFIFSNRQTVQVSPTGAVNFLFYKLLHLIEYATLYILSFRAAKRSWGRAADSHWSFIALLVVIGYGVLDEIHQRFIPTRQSRLRDVIIDAMGGGIGWILIHQLLPRAPKKLRSWLTYWQIL